MFSFKAAASATAPGARRRFADRQRELVPHLKYSHLRLLTYSRVVRVRLDFKAVARCMAPSSLMALLDRLTYVNVIFMKESRVTTEQVVKGTNRTK